MNYGFFLMSVIISFFLSYALLFLDTISLTADAKDNYYAFTFIVLVVMDYTADLMITGVFSLEIGLDFL